MYSDLFLGEEVVEFVEVVAPFAVVAVLLFLLLHRLCFTLTPPREEGFIQY